MHRRKLLEGLRAYLRANPEELLLVDRFDSFICENVENLVIVNCTAELMRSMDRGK